ncbi:magnesium transporter [Paenibacillus apiarius]|uniref:Magnesium transporter MgtE n=1 Tax=Paenibacillus apiarius TaxID=46240 RepID=A0ABT4DRJ0_9BACL|nr:magnesium transporter [Paenibacillus apiarius]MCY9516638.1 magnesium transporter [Paenibacillus apiarius]MCY9519964.1 magnesium transporter [Paenibacillus apiarius]MCY9553797.1 magnesium transporter [Paenibacillus apiarius]MCY9557594.1 magnesium transporter [Paenibacillus apiarius]MCY9685554.1 magnesium transporter [Paenibacillus apiarius]
MIQDLKDRLAEQKQGALKEFLARFQPYDLAEMLMELEESEQIQFIAKLPVDLGAEILEYADPELQYRILDRGSKETAASMLNEMSSDKVVDLLLAIHPHQAETLLELLPADYREKISALMQYPPESAGSLATVDYIAVRNYWTVEHTLQHVRKVGQDAEMVSYFYVLDNNGKLVGIVSLKQAILAKADAKLEEIMLKDFVSVPARMNQREVATILSNYDLVALPVVSEEQRMIGIITVDDLIDVIHEEATEDFQKMGGSQPLEVPYFKNSFWKLFRKRIAWLLVLFVAEAYTGNVLRYFEDTLSEVIALAFFVPLLVGTGGNTGTQTVTTLVRALALGEVKPKNIFRVIRKEVATGLVLGICMGAATFLRAQMLGVGFDIGSVVAITAIFIVIWASLIAAVLPLVLYKLKADPAVVSGPFITTLVDGTGLIIYFTLAKLMLNL